LLKEIAQKFPELPLATVLSAEKKFVEADINRDGVRRKSKIQYILYQFFSPIFLKQHFSDDASG
jgi:hypothetical protein